MQKLSFYVYNLKFSFLGFYKKYFIPHTDRLLFDTNMYGTYSEEVFKLQNLKS